MAESTQLGFEPLDHEPAATIAAASGYILVGFSAQPLRQFTIQNWCDQPVMWSADGSNDWLPMLPNGYFTFDISTNQSLTQGLWLDNNRPLYVRKMTAEGYAAPSTGAVYFSGNFAIDYQQD